VKNAYHDRGIYQLKIDVSHLPGGMYICNLVAGTNNIIGKLIVVE
jgi:hypothetical protein